MTSEDCTESAEGLGQLPGAVHRPQEGGGAEPGGGSRYSLHPWLPGTGCRQLLALLQSQGRRRDLPRLERNLLVLARPSSAGTLASTWASTHHCTQLDCELTMAIEWRTKWVRLGVSFCCFSNWPNSRPGCGWKSSCGKRFCGTRWCKTRWCKTRWCKTSCLNTKCHRIGRFKTSCRTKYKGIPDNSFTAPGDRT